MHLEYEDKLKLSLWKMNFKIVYIIAVLISDMRDVCSTWPFRNLLSIFV